MRVGIVFGGAAVLLLSASAMALDANEIIVKPWEAIHCESPEVEAAEAAGLDPYTHTWLDPAAGIDTTVTVHLLCYDSLMDDVLPATDCTATGYSFTGWRWTTAENYRVLAGGGISSSSAVSIFQTSGETWDGQVAANIYGTVSSTTSGSVPVFNGVNLFRWQDLSSTTIASTWTWSSSGVASESDAAYNTDFAWSTSGAAGAMDLQNIATHELGHTFGLGHSTSGSCLTMYPSGSLGETQKRTLGDGDINGIRARYP